MNLIGKLKSETQQLLHDSRSSHDWEHTLRVLRLAEHIAAAEKADLFIVRIAAILHDIARHDEDQSQGTVCHAEAGAKKAAAILAAHRLDSETIDRIAHCIAAHRFRNSHAPQTLEAKVLFDADKLDSIGAVGIGRAFLFAGEVGAKLHNSGINIENTRPYTEEDTAYREYMVKLRFVKDRILTDEGKRLAERRHNFMISFFNELDKEAEGLA